MEILRASSSSVKSLTVLPPSTVSALGITPPKASSCSTREVLPVAPCPVTAMLRIASLSNAMRVLLIVGKSADCSRYPVGCQREALGGRRFQGALKFERGAKWLNSMVKVALPWVALRRAVE